MLETASKLNTQEHTALEKGNFQFQATKFAL